MESPRTYRATAVVLHRVNIGEADRVVKLYTREKGKLSAIAKGSRKMLSKMAGATEIFTYARYMLAAGRDLEVITQTDIKESFPGIRKELLTVAHASYIVELVNTLVEENEPNYNLFDTLLSTLYLLEGGVDPQIATRHFELQVMSMMGYRPDLDRCVRCGATPKNPEVMFSPSVGGRVCDECGPIPPDVIHLSTRSANAMRQLLAADARVIRTLQLPDDVKDEIARAMRWHIRYRIDRDLKSNEFLQAVLASEAASAVAAESQS